MLNSIYIITIETKLPLPFSYFIKRAALRFFFKFPTLIFLALLFTFIIAVVYFLLSPERELKPQIKAIKPVYRVRPIKRKPTAIMSKEAYKKRLEEKRLKRKELLSKTIKK